MIVPRYWAEARVHERAKGRPVIVRRFGWSDVSQDDAVEVANTRAQEALQRVLACELLPRRDYLRASPRAMLPSARPRVRCLRYRRH